MDAAAINTAVLTAIEHLARDIFASSEPRRASPNLSSLDQVRCQGDDALGRCEAPAACQALRVALSGWPADAPSAKRFLDFLPASALPGKQMPPFPDIDGDGKAESLEEYVLPERAMPLLEGGLLCGRTGWDVVTHDVKPFVYVVSLSRGTSVIVEVSADFLEAQQ